MDQDSISIITGVVSGLVTSALLYLMQRLWVTTIRPFWEDSIYKDVKIEGQWEVKVYGSSVDPDKLRDLIRRVKATESVKFMRILKKMSDEKEKKAEDQTMELSADEKRQSAVNDEKSKVVIKDDGHEGLDEYENFIVNLNRSGHKVCGYMLGTIGSNKGRKYNINGSFRNLILSATMESDSRSCIERGGLSMALTENGRKFEGYLAVYSDKSHSIEAVKTVWERTV